MTMGQRILQARQASGLSQRQLAGDEITRNMLSALEHDTASPSLATLRYLSARLGRPISYFLGEDTPPVDGYETLALARRAFDGGQYRHCAELLDGTEPGAVIAREWSLLGILARMRLAGEAVAEGRLPYARELLRQIEAVKGCCPYFTGERELRLLMARAGMETVLLPEDDALLLRAERALADGAFSDAARYLEAAENRNTPAWHRLRGECAFGQRDYRAAAKHFHRAESDFDLRQRLEVCYRELEDYKMAYFYAKK